MTKMTDTYERLKARHPMLDIELADFTVSFEYMEHIIRAKHRGGSLI